ncbi:MAG: glycerophosphodiester phosphodiesterase family protein [Candidatus Sericytochromatia bacterium]
MKLLNKIILKSERLIHPKIKELIAKSLVYFFTIKEIKEFSQDKYKNFNHLLDKYTDFITIGHRGFSGEYPENTLLSFQKAMEQKVNMIELDITITKDGEIVVFHDVTLLRLAGINKHIRDLTFNELNTIDIGSWFKKEYSGLKIPKLSEVFEILDNKTLINIEIKHEASSFVNRDLEKKVINLIREYNMEKRVVISAFNPMIVNRIRKLAPDISTAYLITQTMTPILIWLLAKINAKYINIDFNYLNSNNVKKIKRKGLKIIPYTLNSENEFKKAFDYKLDGAFTDYPNKLISFLSYKN